MNGWSASLRHVDPSPDLRWWYTAHVPSYPSQPDYLEALVRWRRLRLDRTVHGLDHHLALHDGVQVGDMRTGRWWATGLAGLLPDHAWHTTRPLLAVMEHGTVQPGLWLLDASTRTRRRLPVLPATSLTIGRAPFGWCSDTELVILTPARSSGTGGPVTNAYESRGPGFVSFTEPWSDLDEIAAVTVVVVDVTTGTIRELTDPQVLAAVAVAVSPDGRELLLERVHDDGDTGVRRSWAVLRVRDGSQLDAWGDATEVRRTGADSRWHARERPADGAIVDIDDRRIRVRRGDRLGEPGAGVDIRDLRLPATPTTHWRRPSPPPAVRTVGDGHVLATYAPDGPSDDRACLLWIRPHGPGEEPQPARLDPPLAAVARHRTVMIIDLRLPWPADASAETLVGQVVAGVRSATTGLDRPLIVGGSSFGATLALVAMANLSRLASAIAVSGCYNRTLVPTGFQYEKRTYWQAPEVYHAFSPLLFAHRINRPVLIVHGSHDDAHSTPPEQAVQLYRGLVAAGGHARLVVCPGETHRYVYRESQQLLATEYERWIRRCGPTAVAELAQVFRKAAAWRLNSSA